MKRDPRRATEPPQEVGFRSIVGVEAAFAGILVVAASVAPFLGARRYFFSQDDFAGLARAVGVAPDLSGPWRYVSGQAYFDVMVRVAGLHPGSWHVVSLAVHAMTAALVFILLTRHTRLPVAIVGAAFFGTHAAHYTAIYSISGIGELLAGGFGISAFLLATSGSRWRWGSIVLFALALMSKESVLLIPVVIGLYAHSRNSSQPTNRSTRDPRLVVGLGFVAALHFAAIYAQDVFSIRSGLEGNEAYALAEPRRIVESFLTYVGWVGQFGHPWVRGWTDDVDPAVYPSALVVGLLLVVALALRGSRERGSVSGAAWFVVMLAPVLLLAAHTYHYYLYAPMIGVAWVLATLVDSAAAAIASRFAGMRAWSSPAAWAAAIALSIGLSVSGSLLVRRIETEPLGPHGLRADALVDRARITANVISALRDANLPPNITLLFWSPTSRAMAGTPEGGQSYWERNVEAAVFGGLGVRVMLPSVREVRFVSDFRPDVPADHYYALYRLDGTLRVGTAEQVDRALKELGRGPREVAE